MHRLLGIAATGLTSLRLHPLRNLATLAALIAVLLPFLACLAISRGIEAEAEASIRAGADLYVTGEEFGRNVPVPLAAVEKIRQLDGVTEVVPRIVGSITLGKEREPAIVVGLPEEKLAQSVRCVEGRLPRVAGRNELVIGSELARRLNLGVGSLIPPFYRSDQGERISEIVGVFEADAPLWQARLMLTPFETASALFNETGKATDLLISCRPEYQPFVQDAILNSVPMESMQRGFGLKATTREELAVLIPQGLLHREGIFNLHFVLAFAVGILIVLVTSGIGLAERRREIGILKATGWQTDEVLLRGLVESVALCVAAASLSLLLGWLWLRVFNGYWLASLFLDGASTAPAIEVPCRFAPVPVLLAFVLALALVLSGTLVSTWRAAIAPPWEAMR
jgi:ABC-type lipoprotein release transport system permease subunit